MKCMPLCGLLIDNSSCLVSTFTRRLCLCTLYVMQIQRTQPPPSCILIQNHSSGTKMIYEIKCSTARIPLHCTLPQRRRSKICWLVNSSTYEQLLEYNNYLNIASDWSIVEKWPETTTAPSQPLVLWIEITSTHELKCRAITWMWYVAGTSRENNRTGKYTCRRYGRQLLITITDWKATHMRIVDYRAT